VLCANSRNIGYIVVSNEETEFIKKNRYTKQYNIIYIICAYLRIKVSNTYLTVFLFCSSSSSVPYGASFSGLSIFDCHFGIL
jgi:hypothetical protein